MHPRIESIRNTGVKQAVVATACFLLCTIFGIKSKAENDSPPMPKQEFRGAWVATVHNINWPSRPGATAITQKRELVSILDNAVQNRLNAIIFQVRPACDALYESKLEPWSPFLTGKMGQTPGYDPLEFAIKEAHARGLELHAWFNPYRAQASQRFAPSANHVSKTNPEVVKKYGNHLWLDPGEPWVKEHTLKVIRDVVRRYDVDGIHLDDYFYPYPIKSLEFPDALTYARYKSEGGELSLEDWRRANVDELVKSLYEMIKEEKPAVKFGISPFGIWQPGVPKTIVAQLDAHNHLFADSRKWLKEGWIDYLSPQLYWQIDPPDQSFPVLLKWWHEQNEQKRHVWPGIATDRVRGQDGRDAYEMLRQVGLTRELAKVDAGHIHWNIKALKTDRGKVAGLLRKEAYGDVALVPTSTWLESKTTDGKPRDAAMLTGGAPQVTVAPQAEEGIEIKWHQTGSGWNGIRPKWWVIQLRRTSYPRGTDPWYTAKIIPAAAGGSLNISFPDRFDRIAIRPVSDAGTIGPAGVSALR